MRYLVRRLGFYLIAGWAALTLNFFLPRLMPGDPATALFGRFRGQLSPEALDALRETFGLTDTGLLQQYVTYLAHAVRGDFGISIAYFPAPVSDVIGVGLAWTNVEDVTDEVTGQVVEDKTLADGWVLWAGINLGMDI